MSVSIQTDQNCKTPVQDGAVSAPFLFRYGLDRSVDSIKANQTGQDSLSIQWSENRLVATLCDGVSQSFFGDLSANFLSKQLSEYLLRVQTNQNAEALQAQILEFLNQLSLGFSQTIENHSLEHVTPEFLRGVLERKRHLGSEAVFISLLLDKNRGFALLVWSGDSRIRVWKGQKEITAKLFNSEDFLTQERWSSHKGLVGKLHLHILSPNQFDNLVLYSDGLSIADMDSDLICKNNVQLEELIGQTKTLAGSDDVSFFQMTSSLKAPWNNYNLPLKKNLEFNTIRESGKLFIRWDAVHASNQWELAAASEAGFSILKTDQNIIKTSLEDIPESGVHFALRNAANAGSSAWSEWVYFAPPAGTVFPKKKDDRAAVTKLTTGYVPAHVVSLHNGERAGFPVNSTPVVPPLPPRPLPTPSATQKFNRRFQLALMVMILVVVSLTALLFLNKNKRQDPEVKLPHLQTEAANRTSPSRDYEREPTEQGFESTQGVTNEGSLPTPVLHINPLVETELIPTMTETPSSAYPTEIPVEETAIPLTGGESELNPINETEDLSGRQEPITIKKPMEKEFEFSYCQAPLLGRADVIVLTPFFLLIQRGYETDHTCSSLR